MRLQTINYNPQPQKGFNLVEMMVVVLIIAIISTVSLANYRQGEKRRRIAIASDTAVVALTTAQTYTITGKQINQTTCAIAGTLDKSASNYIMMFGMTNQMHLYGVDKCNIAPSLNGVFFLERYTYPQKVQVGVGGYVLDGTTVDALQFRFTPPFGRLTVSTSATENSGSFNPFTTATITLVSTEGGGSKTITVDGISGRVSQ